MADETSEGYETIWKALPFRNGKDTVVEHRDNEEEGREMVTCEALHDLVNLVRDIEKGTEVHVIMKKPGEDICKLRGPYGGMNDRGTGSLDIFIQVGHDYVGLLPITHFAVRR